MKTKIIPTPARPLSLLAAACLTFTSGLFAQDKPQPSNDNAPRPPRGNFQPGQPPQSRDGQPQRGNFPPGGPQGEGFRGAPNFMAELTEEQRQAVREVMEQVRDEMRDSGERVMTARRELNDMIFAPKLDEKAVREKIMAVAKLEVDSVIVRARAFAKLREKLGVETAEKIKMMFAGPGMMMGQRPGGPGGDFRRSDQNQQPGQRGDGFNQRRGPQDGPPTPGDAPRRPTPPNP